MRGRVFFLSFFIRRPIFAVALSLIMLLAGGVCMLTLPIAQYPPLVPPQVQVSTQYLGASSGIVADTVTTPLEEHINGASEMIYMSSSSTDNGESIINITFALGTNPDMAQMEVLTRSNQALSELPENVRQVGLTIQKQSTNALLSINLVSPHGTWDSRFMQNYADIHIVDELSRIHGVVSVLNAGLSKYAMRIWLDPEKLNSLGLTAKDIRDSIQEQNNQVAAGKLGQAPTSSSQGFTYQLNAKGRLNQVKEFEDIIIKANPDGSHILLKDIGSVKLGA